MERISKRNTSQLHHSLRTRGKRHLDAGKARVQLAPPSLVHNLVLPHVQVGVDGALGNLDTDLCDLLEESVVRKLLHFPTNDGLLCTSGLLQVSDVARGKDVARGRDVARRMEVARERDEM
jgi:hypothetical protein